jgi:hypothetical protein
MRPRKRLKRIILSFEHLPCETRVDVYLPQRDQVLGDGNETTERAAAQLGIACPQCKEPMPFDGFLFETELDEA